MLLPSNHMLLIVRNWSLNLNICFRNLLHSVSNLSPKYILLISLTTFIENTYIESSNVLFLSSNL